DAGDNVLAPLVGTHMLHHLGVEYPPHVLEVGLDTDGTGAAHLAIVHPVFMLGRRHEDFGVRIGERIVGHQQAVNVVAVIVRDNHSIDAGAFVAGGRKVGGELAADAIGLLVVGFNGTGVDNQELGTGVHRNRVIGRRHHVFLHEDFGERRVDGVQFDVGYVIFRHLETGNTVGRHSDFETADLVPIPTGDLLAGGRRGRAYRRPKRQRRPRGPPRTG